MLWITVTPGKSFGNAAGASIMASLRLAAMSDPAAAPIDGPPPSASQLFLAFAQIALSGFGGVLAWARRVIVDERGWLGPQAFNELLALCQVLPGPNIVNFSIMFGSRS